MENVNTFCLHVSGKHYYFIFVLLWQRHIRAMFGVEAPELSAEDEEWQTLINETTYSKTESIKRNSR